MKNESSEPPVFGLVAPDLGKAGRPFAKMRSLLVMSLLVFLCPVMTSAQFGSDMPKWLDAIVGGFTLSGIVGARSGFAINSTSGAFPVSFFLNSPAYVNFDMGLSKRFTMPWSENHRITVRADAFNVTNTNSFSTPNLTLESPSLGRITGSLSTPRELQFAIRYDF